MASISPPISTLTWPDSDALLAARQLFFLVSDIVTWAPAVVFGSVAFMPMPPTAGKNDAMAQTLPPVAGAGLSNGNQDIVSTMCPSAMSQNTHRCSHVFNINGTLHRDAQTHTTDTNTHAHKWRNTKKIPRARNACDRRKRLMKITCLLFYRMCEHMCMYMQNLADGLMGRRGRVPLSTHWKKRGRLTSRRRQRPA